MVVTLVLVIVSGMYDPYLAPLAAAVPLIGFYLAWMWRVLPRLQRSDEKLSLQESMTSQATAHGQVVLWLLEIVSIAFVGASVWMFVADPGSRLTALSCTIFFGLCAAKITRMLMLRHGTATTRP
jgi:hypothetical protein